MLRLLYRQINTGNISSSYRRCYISTPTNLVKHNFANDDSGGHGELPPNNNNNNNEEITDEFTKEFKKNRIKTTDFQKLLLSAGSSIAALIDPHRGDMIACLGEVTGENALRNLHTQMLSSPEGSQILVDKPRINSKTIDLEALGRLPEDSFGFLYHKFLKDNVSTPVVLLYIYYMCIFFLQTFDGMRVSVFLIVCIK